MCGKNEQLLAHHWKCQWTGHCLLVPFPKSVEGVDQCPLEVEEGVGGRRQNIRWVGVAAGVDGGILLLSIQTL